MGSNLWCSAFKSQSCSDLCGFVKVFVFFLLLHSLAFFFFFCILFCCGLDLECWRGCDFRWNLISVGSTPVFCFFNCVGSWLIWILEI